MSSKMLRQKPGLLWALCFFSSLIVRQSSGLTFTDTLDDLSKTYNHSSGLFIDDSNPQNANGDAARVARNNTNNSPAEFLEYNFSGIQQVTAYAIFFPYNDPIVDFKFYVS